MTRKGRKKERKMNKHELPIGQDLEDQKFSTTCSLFYRNYDQCLKNTQGDFLNCRLYRKAMKNCEVVNGYFHNHYKQ